MMHFMEAQGLCLSGKGGGGKNKFPFSPLIFVHMAETVCHMSIYYV